MQDAQTRLAAIEAEAGPRREVVADALVVHDFESGGGECVSQAVVRSVCLSVCQDSEVGIYLLPKRGESRARLPLPPTKENGARKRRELADLGAEANSPVGLVGRSCDFRREGGTAEVSGWNGMPRLLLLQPDGQGAKVETDVAGMTQGRACISP